MQMHLRVQIQSYKIPLQFYSSSYTCEIRLFKIENINLEAIFYRKENIQGLMRDEKKQEGKMQYMQYIYLRVQLN